jgi:hypothetical protein
MTATNFAPSSGFSSLRETCIAMLFHPPAMLREVSAPLKFRRPSGGRRVWLGLLVAGLPMILSAVRAQTPDVESEDEQVLTAAQAEFFESRIRPVLVEHCYSCHSAEAKPLRGGLLLDSRDGLRTGGDSGPAITIGQPAESLLWSALRHESFEMPPDRKLPDTVIADFERWIADGAPDPRVGDGASSVKRRVIDLEEGRKFWSFQPVARPPVPLAAGDWPRDDVDQFIAAGWNGESPAADVPPEILIRRLTFVLHGLSPTPEQQSQFAAAWQRDSEAAIADVVDTLLASPRFGERWGRHWLDVARFAESTGGGRSMMLPDAWRFRDYVIQAFNNDKPFPQLIREHVAGDLLPAADDRVHDEQLTAVGYLALGAINYEEQDKEQLRMDVVDEQIDTLGRTFLGMTLGCARCHDHKFDPIPATDYYALAGIFRSTKLLTPGNVSGFVTATLRTGYDPAALEKWQARDKELEGQIAALKKRSAAGSAAGFPVSALGGLVVDDSEAVFDGEWTPSKFQPPFAGDGYHHSGEPRKGLVARYEARVPEAGEYLVRMVINHGGSRSDRVPVEIAHADGESVVTVNQKLRPAGEGVFAELGRFRFTAEQPARIVVKAVDASPGHVIVDAFQLLPVASLPPAPIAGLSGAVRGDGSTPVSGKEIVSKVTELQQLEAARKAHALFKPEVPTAMCVKDEAQPADWHLHVRGEIRNLGPVVPRGVLSVTVPADRSPALAAEQLAGHSGRRELAEWIASPDNPLTARVYVNRVWQHVFGEALVRTPDNFGATGTPPTHPELLDFLAAEFMTSHDWSTRALVRRLCLSRTFRMASQVPPESMAADPENLQWRRGFRRRVDAEALRDALLAVSGSLDLRVTGGRTIDQLATYDNEFDHARTPLLCRSVYVPAFRNTMLDLFEVFDGANPNLVSGRRNRSTRPAQALYMLNSPFVMEQAEVAAARVLKESDPGTDPEAALRTVWRLVLGRQPSPDEVAIMLPVVTAPDDPTAAWTAVFHSLFASVEFRFLD